MIFAIHKDGRIYPAREMLDAFELAQKRFPQFNYLFSQNVSNSMQI